MVLKSDPAGTLSVRSGAHFWGLILMLNLPFIAGAAPMDEGARWSAFAGAQMDVGPGRDPGDRDDGMVGALLGPELGLQYWLEDWVAVEGALIYQHGSRTSTKTTTRFNYDTTAVRLRVGARIAPARPFSPHLSLGVGYDRFRNDWGREGDKLDSLIGTTEAGLSYGVGQWSLSGYIGFAYPFLTAASVSGADDVPNASTGSIGTRLGYSF